VKIFIFDGTRQILFIHAETFPSYFPSHKFCELSRVRAQHSMENSASVSEPIITSLEYEDLEIVFSICVYGMNGKLLNPI